MDTQPSKTLTYRRAHFVTQLPVDFLYSPSHYWMARLEAGVWRVGLTKFALRMLGEIVDHGFEVQPGAQVQPGTILGWIEGFKAISDIYSIAAGEFQETNPALKQKISLVDRDPYGAGWIYSVQGQPDSNCVDVYKYRDLLDQTIDRLLAQRKGAQRSAPPVKGSS